MVQASAAWGPTITHGLSRWHVGAKGLILRPNQGSVLTLPSLRLTWLWLAQWGQVLVASCAPWLPVNMSASLPLGPGGPPGLAFPEGPKAPLKLGRELSLFQASACPQHGAPEDQPCP